MKYNKCISCHPAELEERYYHQRILSKGDSHIIFGLKKTICRNCGVEYESPKQAKANADLTNKIKLEIIDGMTPARVKEFREKFHLTDAMVYQLFGGGVRTFSKYENGEIQLPASMEKLVWLANTDPSLMVDIAEREGFLLEKQTRERISEYYYKEIKYEQ